MKNAIHALIVSHLFRHKVFERLAMLVPVLIIFISVFSLAAVHNVYATREHAITYGQEVILTLENYISNTAQELQVLSKSLDNHCDKSSVQLLRQYVFHSPTAKEIELFNSEGRIYCSSNQGYTDRQIDSIILSSIHNNQPHTTISFTRSGTHDKAISIYFANNDYAGSKVLLPPEQFIQLISSKLKEHYFEYQVEIFHHSVNVLDLNINNDNELMEFHSQLYPIAISLQVTPLSYWVHFKLNFWKIIFLACLVTLFYQGFRSYRVTRNSLAFSLTEAINNQELELNFQPIVDIHNQKIVGSEALIRWHDKDHGAIPPSVFIPLAEQMQVIEPITLQVFKLVTAFAKQNPHLMKDQYISVNLSRTLVIKPKFIDFLTRYAHRNAAILPLLLIEITEDNNFSTEELVIVRKHLTHLKSLGFKIAMDDFGTGYSGLNFIHQHQFDTIKIDQVFINGLNDNSAIRSVLHSMIKLAKQLQMRVIAEGAETHDQVEQLRLLGIQYIQGFYYFKPLAAEDYLLKLSAQGD